MGMTGMFAQLTSEQFSKALSNPGYLEELLDGADENMLLDVDKSWEEIYFILTGAALAEDNPHPMGRVVFSGQFFDENQDLGYGPGHYLTPQQVKELNAELRNISEEELQRRYDGKIMDEKGVYPEGWEEEESFEYLKQNFLELQLFYQSAADKNNAIVTYIT